MIYKATKDMGGCWIDGHWGQYGPARLIELAAEHGYADAEAIDLATRHLASIGPSDAPGLDDDEAEALFYASDAAEEWLNSFAAPDGFSFGWHDGEFFLWDAASWEAEA